MIECEFDLNNRPMSTLKVRHFSFPAFSGSGFHTNRKDHVCHRNIGAIPPGRYYIVDRQSGGVLGPLREFFSDKKDWFALYAIDSRIDDETYCDGVKRGNFRLHPKGLAGISEGCVTLESRDDFNKLKILLRGSETSMIPGSQTITYGILTVE